MLNIQYVYDVINKLCHKVYDADNHDYIENYTTYKYNNNNKKFDLYNLNKTPTKFSFRDAVAIEIKMLLMLQP